MSPLWSRLTVRSLSVALLATALGGGVYAGYDREPEPATPQADAPPPAVDPVALEQAIQQRSRASMAASRQRSAQERVARTALKKARLATAKAKREAAAAAARKKREAATPVYDGPIPTSCREYSGNRAIGCAEMVKAGFKIAEFGCLERLWTKESGWNHKAVNPSSGAGGIPQAYPASKMASAGDDWRTNPATQIRWGLGYIKQRYQTPCGAWSHFKANGSY